MYALRTSVATDDYFGSIRQAYPARSGSRRRRDRFDRSFDVGEGSAIEYPFSMPDTPNQVLFRLIARTVPLTLASLPDKGKGSQMYPALFAHAGATPAARTTLTEAEGYGGRPSDVGHLPG